MWAREKGCPWDEETCRQAEGYGKLDVPKRAHENSCPHEDDEHSSEAEASDNDVEEGSELSNLNVRITRES